MRTAGALLMFVGAALALFAFTMNTTVTTEGSFIAGSYVGGGSTYNLGLLQHQMMVLHVGLAGFLAGAFLFGSDARAPESDGATSARAAGPPDQPANGTEQEGGYANEMAGWEQTTRREIIIGGIVAVVVLIAIAWAALRPETQSSAYGSMNVNENLSANFDENLPTTAVNQM